MGPRDPPVDAGGERYHVQRTSSGVEYVPPASQAHAVRPDAIRPSLHHPCPGCFLAGPSPLIPANPCTHASTHPLNSLRRQILASLNPRCLPSFISLFFCFAFALLRTTLHRAQIASLSFPSLLPLHYRTPSALLSPLLLPFSLCHRRAALFRTSILLRVLCLCCVVLSHFGFAFRIEPVFFDIPPRSSPAEPTDSKGPRPRFPPRPHSVTELIIPRAYPPKLRVPRSYHPSDPVFSAGRPYRQSLSLLLRSSKRKGIVLVAWCQGKSECCAFFTCTPYCILLLLVTVARAGELAGSENPAPGKVLPTTIDST